MFSIWSLNRLHRKLLLGLICGVFLMSCLLVIAGDTNGPQGAIIEMEKKYIASASKITFDGEMTETHSVVMPGVPLMIAGLTKLFGDDGAALTAYRLVQCFFHAFSVYLVFVLARYMFNVSTAFLACVIYALYWPAYGIVRLILPDSTMQMLMLLLVCSIIGALELKQAGWYVVTGILTAFVACFNLQALLYPLLFSVLWWRYRSPKSVVIIGSLLVLAGYILVMSPWWISIPLFAKLAYLPGPWNIAPLWLDARFIEGNPFLHLYRSIFGGLSTKYSGRFANEEARRVVQSALDGVRLILLYAGTVGLAWSAWKYRLKRQLPVLLTLLYFIAAEWMVPSLDGTGFPYGVFILLYAAFLTNKAVFFAHRSSLHRASAGRRKYMR